MRIGNVAGVVLALCAVPCLGSQAPTSTPRVHVIATGGTISNLGVGRRTGEELVSAIPQIAQVARVTVEQFSNVASGAITQAMWRDLALRIKAIQSEPDAPAGFVVTHGTDTMEETAFFLALTTGGCSPVVVTGAMRQANAVGADGPANLLNAIRVAAHPSAQRRGAMVLMNDEIFAAREVTKSNTTRLNAFTAPNTGPLGLADPDRLLFYDPAPGACPMAAVDVGRIESFPRVDVVYAYIGADSVGIDAVVAAGARAIVVAGVGRGGTTPSQRDAIQRAGQRGVLVVMSNRSGSGRTSSFVQDNGNGALVGAGDLNPQKTRIGVMLGLAAGLRVADIARLIDPQ